MISFDTLVLHATVLSLDPEVLHSQAESSVRALLKEGESANTIRSYASALRYWAAWFRLRYLHRPPPTRSDTRGAAISRRPRGAHRRRRIAGA